MKTLLLAPQPFFLNRGTPIAVRMLLEFFSRRGWKTDAVVLAGGEDVAIPGVRFFRVPRPPLVRQVRPGFSLAKLVCDVALFLQTLELVRDESYDYVHCVEEASFIGLRVSHRRHMPYVYDMDSSMPEQMAEKHAFLRPVLPMMRRFEDAALRDATAVIAVCDALAETARRAAKGPLFLLRDPPATPPADPARVAELRRSVDPRGPLFVYVGNLEGYQGIDLLLASFGRLRAGGTEASLAVIGGTPKQAARFRRIADRAGLDGDVHFPGSCSLADASAWQSAADALVSPRLHGRNTPMKIYGYLQSGRPIVATDIVSHTQVLTPEVAQLAAPEPAAFAAAMKRLADDGGARQRLGANALRLSQERFSLAAYEQAAGEFCSFMESKTAPTA